MVLVTRADLKLTKGKLAAQCGHAVSECVLKASSNDAKLLKRYLENGARKIVVAAPHLEALRTNKNFTIAYKFITFTKCFIDTFTAVKFACYFSCIIIDFN